jgi:aspartyl-tRNA(Asn)/glutamyl-tRNA(Gln) amidotransferase subunit A
VTERFVSLHRLSASIARRRITPSEVIDEVKRRHIEHGRYLNDYVAWDEAPAIEAMPALLTGIPISIKDCIGVKGLPMFAGTRRRLSASWESEGPVVSALRRQSAILVGKTVQTEFALSALGLTPGFPQPRNPWDAKQPRSAGGSSTGAALSLLGGTALLALGTDTLGSVRIPASVAGIVGFRPAAGRWPTDGVVPLSPTFDTIGLLANDVADLQFAFTAIDSALTCKREAVTEPEGPAETLNIGLPESVWSDCENSIARAGQHALDRALSGPTSVIDVTLPEAAEAFSFVQEGSVAVAEFDAFIAAKLPEFRGQLSPPTAVLAERGERTSARRYLHDLAWQRDMAARAAHCFERVDVVAFPTVPLTPPTLDELERPDVRRHFHLNMLRNTCIASVLGFCAISIPIGFDAVGIPVGIELAAPAGRERVLLSAARMIEQRLGTGRELLGEPPALRRVESGRQE